MSITVEEIKKVVESEDDFGHEMRVGAILGEKRPPARFARILFFPPDHGGTYQDPKLGKTRQFDYRLKIEKGIEDVESILFAVECKNLSCPLVVCGREREPKEAFHTVIVRDGNANTRLKKMEGGSSLYKAGNFVGKSLLRLKVKNNQLTADSDSEIYDRWAQAIASCHDLAFQAGVLAHKENHSRASFLIPTVVLPNDSLWIASYGNDGKIRGAPQPVSQCEYFVGEKCEFRTVNFVLTHVHFLTLNGLSQLLSKFANSESSEWDDIFNFHGASDFNPFL